RLTVRGERDVGHRPDRPAADVHVVARHELARVREDRADRVAPAPEEQDPDEHDGGDHRRRGDVARKRGALSLPFRRAGQSLSKRGCRGHVWTVSRRPLSPLLAAPNRARLLHTQRPARLPERNCRTNWLSELKSSDAGPDSTMRPFQRIAMYSAT